MNLPLWSDAKRLYRFHLSWLQMIDRETRRHGDTGTRGSIYSDIFGNWYYTKAIAPHYPKVHSLGIL